MVGLTRYFADPTAGADADRRGIKCYALCPWFADTKLVREASDISKGTFTLQDTILYH